MQSEHRAANTLSIRAFAALGLVAAYILVQSLVPLRATFLRQRARYGWTMYAYTAPYDLLRGPAIFQIRFRDGHMEDLREINQKHVIARTMRAEIDLQFVPAHLCARLPDAVEIQVRPDQSTSWQSYPCP